MTVHAYFFKKLFYTFSKKRNEPDEDFIPTSSAKEKKDVVEPDKKMTENPVPKVEKPEVKSEEPTQEKEVQKNDESQKPVVADDFDDEDLGDDSLDFVDTSKVESNATSAESEAPSEKNVDQESAESDEDGKVEKRSLTDREFWTILLTPEFDAKAFKAVKRILAALMKLFVVKFENCFVEGIRMEYHHMGYGAALNGIMKSFPYIGAWDLRMDWTNDHEFKAEGHIRASVNLCRLFGLILVVLLNIGYVFFSFRRRRAHVLKTNKLPTLGWIRSKIVNLMAEE